jgi:hypothetical protein
MRWGESSPIRRGELSAISSGDQRYRAASRWGYGCGSEPTHFGAALGSGLFGCAGDRWVRKQLGELGELAQPGERLGERGWRGGRRVYGRADQGGDRAEVAGIAGV